MTPKSGKAIAWLSFLLGIAVSIAGNIGHAASDGMKPGEWAGAAFWPLALMLTIEILTRVRWQAGKRWAAARIAGLVLVALVAAVLSYRHLAGLMTYWGEDWLNAHLGPLAVDGLMLVAATALLSISKEGSHATTDDVPDSVPAVLDAVLDAVPAVPEPAAEPVRLPAPPVEQPTPTPARVPEPAAQVERSRLHVVQQVSTSDAEEAARQAWVESGGKLSAQQVADLAGISKSTAHRRITRQWSPQR